MDVKYIHSFIHSFIHAPVLFVRKKDGSLRMCVDYCAINNITQRDQYLIPHIDDLLCELHGAKYFTTLDLASGYHQLQVVPEDVHKTAFQTPYGAFEFLVLPFGLTNAPSAFMWIMTGILWLYLGQFIQIYLDDIVIYS